VVASALSLLLLAGPGMVAFDGDVQKRIHLGIAELNSKAPFDDGGAVLLHAWATRDGFAIRYRVTADASMRAVVGRFRQRFCTEQPLSGLIRQSHVAVTAFFTRGRARPFALRVDAAACAAAQ